ncbi:MAG: glycosyltransferase [Pseudomonadales bacterium]
MAAFNGEHYIASQLESIVRQDRPPDEVVIVDDCSTDGTIKILEDFFEETVFDVSIIKNKKNIGYVRSFEKAIQATSGDLIFLCDQDDFWFSDKISRIESTVIANSKPVIIINDLQITDENLNPTGYTKLAQRRRIGLSDEYFVVGCGSAFTSEFRSFMKSIPVDLITHDVWLHRLGRLLGCRVVVSDVLQYYRRHGKNASSSAHSEAGNIYIADMLKKSKRRFRGEGRLEYQRRIRLIDIFGEAMDKWQQQVDINLPDVRFDQGRAILEDERKSFFLRQEILDSSKLKSIILAFRLQTMGGYKWFNGYKSFLADLVWR